MAPISETSLFRITNLVGLIRGERRRLKRIRDLQSQYRADLLEYEEERDDGYRLAVFMQTRLLENAAMPVSTSPVWGCLSAYLHSVARTTPKPLCCQCDSEHSALLTRLSLSHESERLCVDWIRHHEASLREALTL